MDLKNLNHAFTAIVDKKVQLSKLSMEDEGYSGLQRQLSKLEEEFSFEYGAYVEDALFNVYDEYCPDNDIQTPLAYLANHYLAPGDGMYEVPTGEGVQVDADDYPGVKAWLVLMPNPMRLVLHGDAYNFTEVVWVVGRREEVY